MYVLNHSILKRAQEKDVLQVNTVDFRHFAENKHNQVDDYLFVVDKDGIKT